MLHLSINLLIFVASLGNRRQHREELLSFDPSVNLDNSCMRARSLKTATPVVAYIQLSPSWSRLTPFVYFARNKQ